MEHDHSCVEKYEKFTWKLENFSRRKTTHEVSSEPFVLGGYPWRIDLYPNGHKVNSSFLAIYLDAVKTANMSEGWKRDVKFKLLLFNQLDPNITITKEFLYEFTEFEKSKGALDFIKIQEINDRKKGFLVKDACIFGAEVLVCNSTNEKRIYETVNFTSSLTSGSQIGHREVEVLGQNSDIQVAPNLESPSALSVEPTKNCDVEFVFAGLRRIIFILQTRKVKDMNEQACKELQVLWDEIEKYKFDLTWLKPHVRYALGMKRFVKKAMEIEKLNDKLVVLELETMRLREKLISAQISFDVERQLLKTKGVKEIGLTYDLGCGTWKG